MSTLPPANLHDPTTGATVATIAADAPPLDMRRILWATAAAVAGLMGVLGIVAWLFRDPLIALGERFVETLGGPGVAVGFFIPDAFTVPLPNDAFSMFGLIGGMDFWVVVLWGTAGSLAGGSTGFLIGRSLRRTERFQRLMARRGREIQGLVSRYGTTAILVAALTPLPYSIACWASGAMGMRFSTFFLVSTTRVFRVAGYLWLIEAGLFSFE